MDREKKNLKRYIIYAFLMLIPIPFLLDRFLAHQWYMLWFPPMKVESPMKVGEWFGFLGSYLGFAGTVFIGVISYYQTSIIHEQSKDLDGLQKQLADFQIHPAVRIEKADMEIVDGQNKRFSTAEDIERYYFSVYGEEWKSSGKWYVKIRIPFEDKGAIPTVQCMISDFEWEIAGKSYSVKLREIKRTTEAYNMVNILVDGSDPIYILQDNGEILGCGEEFFRDLNWHRYYHVNRRDGYDKSILKLTITFINQKKYRQSYGLTYWISNNSGNLVTGSPFLKIKEE